MKNQIKISESEIQKSVIEYLKYKKYYVIRLNSGNQVKEYNGKKYMIKMQEAGMPDLMAFRSYMSYGITIVKLYFFEIKAPGKKPTAMQMAKMGELEAYGAICRVITDVKELEAMGI